MTEPTYQFIPGKGWVPSVAYMTVKSRDGVLIDLVRMEDPYQYLGKPYFYMLKSANQKGANWYSWWDKEGNVIPERIFKHFSQYDWHKGWSKLTEGQLRSQPPEGSNYYHVVPHE